MRGMVLMMIARVLPSLTFPLFPSLNRTPVLENLHNNSILYGTFSCANGKGECSR